jgi:CubicO group peptidase (beta-lactamase class C family)
MQYDHRSCNTTLSAVCDVIRNWTLLCAPGSCAQYSNLGFALLGHGLAALANATFEQAVQDAVFAPLGMQSSGFVPPANLSRLALPFDANGRLVPPYALQFENPAGGAFTTVRDLAALMSLLFEAAPDNMPVPFAADAAASRASPASPSSPSRSSSAQWPFPPSAVLRNWVRTFEHPFPVAPPPGAMDQVAYGFPWEVWRANLEGLDVAPTNFTVFDLTVKTGDIIGYDAFFGLIEPLQLGLIVQRTQAPRSTTGIADLSRSVLGTVLAPGVQSALVDLTQGIDAPSGTLPAASYAGFYMSTETWDQWYNATVSVNPDGSLSLTSYAVTGGLSTRLVPAGTVPGYGDVFSQREWEYRSCRSAAGGLVSVVFVRDTSSPTALPVSIEVEGSTYFPSVMVRMHSVDAVEDLVLAEKTQPAPMAARVAEPIPVPVPTIGPPCPSPALPMPLPSNQPLPQQIQDALNLIEQSINGWLNATTSTAISLGVVYKDQLVYHTGAGVVDPRNSSSGAPDLDTIFMVGSITKVMTDHLLLQVANDPNGPTGSNAITMDTLLESLLPNCSPQNPWDNRPGSGGGLGGPTLRQLGSHTGGIHVQAPCGADIGTAWTSCNTTTIDVCNTIKNWTLMCAPGSCVQYSNLAFGLLGHGLEAALGVPYEMLMQASVFDPLGMASTSLNPPGDLTRLAIPFGENGQIVEPYSYEWASPMGGAFSSVRDLTAFMTHFFVSGPDNLPVQFSVTKKPDDATQKQKRGDATRTDQPSSDKWTPPPLPPYGALRNWIKAVEFPLEVIPPPGEIQQIAYGLPWEIWRANFDGMPYSSTNMSVFDMIIKLGDVTGYDDFFGMIPELELGLIIQRSQAPFSNEGIWSLGLNVLGSVLAPAFQSALIEFGKNAAVPTGSLPAQAYTGLYMASGLWEQWFNATVMLANDGSLCMTSSVVTHGRCLTMIPAGTVDGYGDVFSLREPSDMMCRSAAASHMTIVLRRDTSTLDAPTSLEIEGFYFYPAVLDKSS